MTKLTHLIVGDFGKLILPDNYHKIELSDGRCLKVLVSTEYAPNLFSLWIYNSFLAIVETKEELNEWINIFKKSLSSKKQHYERTPKN